MEDRVKFQKGVNRFGNTITWIENGAAIKESSCEKGHELLGVPEVDAQGR